METNFKLNDKRVLKTYTRVCRNFVKNTDTKVNVTDGKVLGNFTEKNNFTCSRCKLILGTRAGLQRHVKKCDNNHLRMMLFYPSVAKEFAQGYMVRTLGVDSSPSFVCVDCSRSFPNHRHLKAHRKVHQDVVESHVDESSRPNVKPELPGTMMEESHDHPHGREVLPSVEHELPGQIVGESHDHSHGKEALPCRILLNYLENLTNTHKAYEKEISSILVPGMMQMPQNLLTSTSAQGSGGAQHQLMSQSPAARICKEGTDGRTRAKDKYRLVYSDHQRLELEKEFHYNRYITIRRKAELAQALTLSEQQVKVWFQNRRVKERKQGCQDIRDLSMK